MPAAFLYAHWYRLLLSPPFAQATCMCWPGMTSINNDASEGCHVSCKPHSCDKSATCQVTPDRKTRLAQGTRGMGTGRGWNG